NDEQRGQRIGVGGVAIEVELENAEQRPDRNALQAVAAAGEPVRTVRRLEGEQPEAERDHDQCEMAEARDDEAYGIADNSRRRRRHDQAAERIAPPEFGDQSGGIGADAEKRGMAERNDAGIAEDDVEREREQRGDGDLARQR